MTKKPDTAPVDAVVSTRPDVGELAFEFEDSPLELWRVVSHREFLGRALRNINWFATEQAARRHAAWINDGRGKVLSVTKYRAC